MEDNKNFKTELELNYLCILADHEQKDEFMNRFSNNENRFAQMADESMDLDILSKLKRVIEYKKELSLVGEMTR